MIIDFKETIKQLKAIQKQFNDKDDIGATNSFACLMATELVAKELLRFVDNYRNLYFKSMMDEFLRKNVTTGHLERDILLEGIKKNELR